MTTTKKKRRDYGKGKDGKKRTSVTTVLGAVLAKPGLLFWSAKLAAEYVFDNINAGTREAIVERARKIHIEKRDDAADAGTMAHAMCEAFLLGETYEPDVFAPVETVEKARAAAAKFIAWFPTSGYRAHLVEHQMIDETTDVGGTIDIVLERGGEFFVADLKTGKGVYDEVMIQLGQYTVMAERALGIKIAGGLLIHSPVSRLEGQRPADDPNGEPEMVLVDPPLSVVPITRTVLDLGAVAFSSLLTVYRSRKTFEAALNASTQEAA